MDTAEGHSLPSASCGDGRKRRVCYYYDPGIANVDYGADHHMVPRRVAMAHALVEKYGLLADMERLRIRPATEAELRAFHDDAYVRLLRDITPDAYHGHRDGDIRDRATACQLGVPGTDAAAYDNPVIDGLWDYCLRYAGGFNVPLLLLGGGGYTVNHVACCWCYETAVAVGKEEEISDDIPFHGYEHYYRDQGYKLHFKVPKRAGNKIDDATHKIKQDALMNLAMLKPPPTTVGQHRPSKSHAINVEALCDQKQDKKPKKYRYHREDDDPMERLHRLCVEADRYNFFTELGKRKKCGLVNTTPSVS
ncbi:hypothetical protein VPH35_091270 [Triticum aestivum]